LTSTTSSWERRFFFRDQLSLCSASLGSSNNKGEEQNMNSARHRTICRVSSQLKKEGKKEPLDLKVTLHRAKPGGQRILRPKGKDFTKGGQWREIQVTYFFIRKVIFIHTPIGKPREGRIRDRMEITRRVGRPGWGTYQLKKNIPETALQKKNQGLLISKDRGWEKRVSACGEGALDQVLASLRTESGVETWSVLKDKSNSGRIN